MLFNSYAFILIFLPFTFIAYHALRRARFERAAIGFLVFASLVFYGWWSPVYLILLVALILANFAAVKCLISLPSENAKSRKLVLTIGIAGNLAMLGYFKYANFFVDSVSSIFSSELSLAPIVLPLGISFFTFQKIALLVDTYQGKVRGLNFLDYALFVSFFPQLIAGPIVHHSEMMPQFKQRGRVAANTIALGVVIFVIGLCKKVFLADTLAGYASPEFDAAAASLMPTALEAWSATLAYSLQLYFDFSGYSDMAIGAALLFGIRLPLNFASPYKAESVIEFWRRWHMTLSRFLRDYLYIPLGGNRLGPSRRYANLFITMLLGGLWHGASGTFVVWGGMHAIFLIVNHGWRVLRRYLGGPLMRPSRIGRFAGSGLTFLVVTVGWVFFRSPNLSHALRMVKAMACANGVASSADTTDTAGLLLIGSLLVVAWFAPNSQEITGYAPPSGHLDTNGSVSRAWFRLNPSLAWAVVCGGLFASALMSLSKVSEYLYFQF